MQQIKKMGCTFTATVLAPDLESRVADWNGSRVARGRLEQAEQQNTIKSDGARNQTKKARHADLKTSREGHHSAGDR
jgi:hypothetical protein